MLDEDLRDLLLEDGQEPGSLPGEAAGAEQRSASAARPRRVIRAGRKKPVRAIEIALFSVALCLLLAMALLAGAVLSLGGGLQGLTRTSGTRTNPPAGTYSVLFVEGTIQTGGSGYQHTATVDYIKKMTEDEDNLGLLLYLNSSGGGVYESDEVYRALTRYKEETGRPVWAYMGKTCASGGYYIAAAADKIYANPGTTTGSIGVYYQLTDTSGLYEKLGVETVLVRSGSNKGIGVDGVEISEENRAVYQGMVDESYDIFIGIVAEGRGLSDAEARRLGDGRPYTANQALANGLVDELAEYEDVKLAFADECGGEAYNTSFSGTNALRQIVNSIWGGEAPGETQALLELADSQQSGLMAQAEGLA